MSGSRYLIGIDLGTTNSALAYIDRIEKVPARIETFPIPQLVDEGIVQNREVLPSFLYLPGEYELPGGSISLPWDAEISYSVGEFARVQGARIPGNLVSSAKSWLSHARVDRKGPILPWGRETAAKRVSPVEASARYLKHLKDAWNYAVSAGDPEQVMEKQQLVITIPASFDETARELTFEAAHLAGLEGFTLLEEPQAAFYFWLATHGDAWRSIIEPDRLILVFDVGGGTTDFTLITVKEEGEKPSFRRVAVGDHIMLGGDNMDLALAREMEKKMMGPSGKFDYHQWLSAVQQCRAAKEELLGGTTKESVPVTLLGTGRKVIGETLTGELTVGTVTDTIIGGFFQRVEAHEEVQRGRTSGLQELGLPYVSDTSVMRHLASFLKRHASNRELPHIVDPKSDNAIVRPDMLLFNGGVFKSPLIREHAASVIREWFSPDASWSLRILENGKLDHAVALGAAYYSSVREGRGERIAGGTGRAYYIGVEKEGEKGEPSLISPLTSVCVLPRGFEEGEEIHLSYPEFQVLTNSPVSFTLYSSSYRAGDKPGDVITAERDEFVELPPIRTVLHFGKSAGRVRIPVSLGIRLNEFGTLDVWCESKKTPHRWKLAFQLRMEDELQTTAPPRGGGEKHTLTESVVAEAISLIGKAFSSSPRVPSEVTPENLIKKVEELLELERNDWPLSSIRKMWDALITMKEKRRTTSRHEARWLNLSGFLLRPGFGDALDDWRIRELWKLISEGLAFPGDTQCSAEWWVMWRRVAGGLDASQQDILFRKVAPWLLPSRKKAGIPKQPDALVSEMWMLAASLENLPPSLKEELGNELVRNPKRWKGRALGHYFWALSRIGARVPFHGTIDRVVPREVVEAWIVSLLDAPWPNPGDAVYALAQMARKTGDRSRDIDEGLRTRIIERISVYPWAKRSVRQIQEAVSLEWEDEKSIFGESLPEGLSLKLIEKDR
ncbi:MAG: hsp70 family protein [Alphaproteobacteria bacterium]|uniref:Hsp70 family protein n=1 Tax=Candidatus Nitrobium versatile TaxID=2884831 RepID=A0A953J5A4_9BACT|nr:hsp70 family protein [Candidatus Nitrobium versatile]